MTPPEKNLGRLVKIYGVQPAYVQRAVFVVILSFIFFLAMMFTFYVTQGFVYFLLASAFLLVYILTLSSWLLQRRNRVKIYEHGVEYRKNSSLWNEIESIAPGDSRGLEVIVKSGRKFTIPGTIAGLDEIIKIVKAKI